VDCPGWQSPRSSSATCGLPAGPRLADRRYGVLVASVVKPWPCSGRPAMCSYFSGHPATSLPFHEMDTRSGRRLAGRNQVAGPCTQSAELQTRTVALPDDQRDMLANRTLKVHVGRLVLTTAPNCGARRGCSFLAGTRLTRRLRDGGGQLARPGRAVMPPGLRRHGPWCSRFAVPPPPVLPPRPGRPPRAHPPPPLTPTAAPRRPVWTQEPDARHPLEGHHSPTAPTDL